MTATRATVYLVCIWGVSVTCACLPMTSMASYVYIEDIGACTVDWEKSNWGYTVAKYFVGFCLPLAMILFCYAKIYIVARRVKRQIRPAPANLGGPEHTSRWANEKSQCDALTGEVSQASPRKRQPGARVDRPSTSLPDNMRYHGNSDQVYRAKITDTNGSTLSEGQREPRAAKADIKRSKSAQHVWRGDLVNGTHSDKGLANVKCSVPAGLAIVPSIFQNDANVPTIRTDDYVPLKHKTVQKRFSLNEGTLRNKREKGKHKSSTSGESGEWKTFTSKQTARKVAKLKKMQSIRDTKAATTLLILLGVFLLCWIPYVAVCFLLNAQVHVNARVHCAAFMVALTNSVLNVFVYGVLNTKFRMGFRKLWKPCCLWISCRCLKRRNTDPGLRIRSISHSLRNNGVISERAVNGK
ncbi:uncharacterized protein [Diadema setosum]|uniref:uncharacterized protein n=1 Tax=Diadema setosum TaxID=31175 RepID=UPI003B3BC6DA